MNLGKSPLGVSRILLSHTSRDMGLAFHSTHAGTRGESDNAHRSVISSAIHPGKQACAQIVPAPREIE